MPLVVGFDLDMTLLDSRPGIRKSLDALSEESGTFIDTELVLCRLGPKLEDELAEWFPAAEVDTMAARYREIYLEHCVNGGTLAFAGARESVDAVRARGGRVIAITAKAERSSWRCLEEVAIAVDAVVGHVHGDEKRDAIVAHDVSIYVGDTIADVRAGVDAGITSVGVTTGMHDAAQLTAAGAHIVFPTLEPFPEWLGEQMIT